MKDTKKLYKIVAHCGHQTHIYFAVATTITDAEIAIESLHKKEDWIAIDSVNVETVAEEYAYGKPVPLVLA